MATRGVKRKLHLQHSSTEPMLSSLVSPFTLVKRRKESSDLESSEGSSKSLQFDASYIAIAEDDVQAVARALIVIASKLLEAIRQLVRRLTPARVASSLDWDLLDSEHLRKMAGGHTHWTEAELKAFFDSCMEEIEGRTITFSCPKAQGYVNMQNKMYEKASKVVNRQQLKNFWDHCRRRFQTWTWLESMATSLGRDPYTGSIQASSDWWQQMEGLRSGAHVFRNAPLRFIAEHHAVYEGRTVLLNCSGVAGSRPAEAQVPQEAEILDMEDLTHLALVMPSPKPSSAQRRGKGKRIMTPGSASGGSSKRTCSDSTGDALNRLANLRVQSNESRARREELRQVAAEGRWHHQEGSFVPHGTEAVS